MTKLFVEHRALDKDSFFKKILFKKMLFQRFFKKIKKEKYYFFKKIILCRVSPVPALGNGYFYFFQKKNLLFAECHTL